MGLDSYLNRMPRYKNTTAKEVNAIEGYLDWLKAKKEGSEYANCTLKEWCGVDESELPSKDVIEYYKQFYIHRYSAWDTDHKYGYDRIMEQVGYWRKANQIHAFFVENVQDGEDDCSYHNECTKEILEDLLDRCYNVHGKWVDCMEPGKVIINPEVAEELLPSCGGFFFGSTSYDEWYMQDIENTIKIIKNVLATTDFETQMLAYCSSW